MISILLALHGIPVKSESQCDPYEYQNCQGECIDLLQIKPNISIPWLCGDQCQTFSKPCNGKCPYGLYLTCNQTCALQSLATTDDSWNCKDDCQPTSEPCSGKCLTPFHNCKNECRIMRGFFVRIQDLFSKVAFLFSKIISNFVINFIKYNEKYLVKFY